MKTKKRKQILVTDVKDVDYDKNLHLKGAIGIFKDEYDNFWVSAEDKCFHIGECTFFQHPIGRMDTSKAFMFLGDVVSFVIKENNRKTIYFAAVQRETNYPMLIYKRVGNLAEICFLPDETNIENPNINTMLDGDYWKISLMSYNIVKNKTNYIRNSRNRKLIIPELEKLLIQSKDKDEIIHKELEYMLNHMNESQIFYSDMVNIYSEKIKSA